MKVEYDLSPADLLTFSKEGYKGTSFHNFQVAIMTVIGAVFMASDFLLLLASVYLNDGAVQFGNLGTTVLLKLIVWAVVLVGIWATLTLVAKRGAARTASEHQGVNGVFCQHLIEIGDDGFTESTEVNRTFHSWRSVESVRETPNLVLLTIRLGGIYFIPKRSFDSDEHRNAFMADAEKRILLASVPPPPASATTSKTS